MFYIFWANASKWKYIKWCGVKQTFMYQLLCRFYYFKHIASIIFGWSENNSAYKKRVRYFLLHQHVQIFWYGSKLTKAWTCGLEMCCGSFLFPLFFTRSYFQRNCSSQIASELMWSFGHDWASCLPYQKY